MSIMPIYLYGTDVLRATAKPVKAMDDSLTKLVVDMFETMHKANGIGLAATQVGDLRRVLVIDIVDIEELPEKPEGELTEVAEYGHLTSPHLPRTVAMINPEIIEEEGAFSMEEGCLSIPDIRADVKRAEKVRVRFRDTSFQEQVLVLDGLLARVFLHENDHLNGVLFTDRVSTAKKGLLRGKLKKIQNGEVETSYPVVASVEA